MNNLYRSTQQQYQQQYVFFLLSLFHIQTCIFPRYSPLTYPVYMKFTVDEIEIPENKYTCNQTRCKIELGQLKKNFTGTYRCEVSGDAPHFKVASKDAHMTVAGKCFVFRNKIFVV